MTGATSKGQGIRHRLGRDLACHGGESFDSLRSLRTPLDSAFRACHERGPKGSTFDQEPENQLQELRRYVEARGWTGQEYVDRGVSGAKDRRPTLDALVSDAKRRKFDVLVCWRLDRLGRNLRHLVTLIEELQTMGIAFISLGEGIDCTTPAGKLQLHILAALAEFERARIQERVKAGLARARAQGVRLGRPRRRIDAERLATVAGLPEREAARRLGIPRSTLQRWLARKPGEINR